MPDSSQIASYARLLRLTEVENADAPRPAVAEPIVRVDIRPRQKWPKALASMLLLLVLPSTIGAAYFWGLSADRYVSEVRFVLRVPSRAVPNATTATILQSTGISRSTDDGFVIQEYLRSRDAMHWLEEKADLRSALSKAEWDPAWRFPRPFGRETQEGLYRHFTRMVSASFDKSTGIGELQVQAFAPEDAQRFADQLLEAAEKLVNRLNERAQRDAVELTEREVERLRERVLVAQEALTAFRERERTVDPTQTTLAVLEAITRLASEAAQSSVQINELMRSSPNSPQIPPLRARRAALEEQIAIERHRLAGDAKSIAPRIVEYERLMLEREFAQKGLLAAMAALELARMEGLRHQVYLERVAAPSRPDYPAYPWRIVWCLVTVAASYMAWRIWRILAADAQRHAES